VYIPYIVYSGSPDRRQTEGRTYKPQKKKGKPCVRAYRESSDEEMEDKDTGGGEKGTSGVFW